MNTNFENYFSEKNFIEREINKFVKESIDNQERDFDLI